MTERRSLFLYSPPLLTEGSIFEVASDGRKFITKKDNILTLVDSISLAVIEEFGTYPEAEVYIGVYGIGKDVVILEGSVSDNFTRQLCCFNPDVNYFSVIRNGYLFSYCTETWEIHSAIKCPVSCVGIIYTDCYTVALWTSSGKFIVLSLLGDEIFSMASGISSRIKAVELCRERRVLAVATFDDKVELFDVLSWEKLYSFKYPVTLNNEIAKIWNENSINFHYSEKQLFVDNKFEKKTNLSISTIKNMNDEFKIKSNLKFRLSYSQDNKLLASYTPGFPNIVWIWSLRNKKIAGVISLNESSIQGLRWHPTKEILAILTPDSVIVWRELDTSVIYCKNLLTSFHWINTKLTICGIATEKECMLVYLDKTDV